jgi:hypothetical protein
MLTTVIDRVGEWNPQLFREAKGRLTGRNIAIATSISLFTQGLVYLCFRSLLPPLELERKLPLDPYNYPRSSYCSGQIPGHQNYGIDFCIPDPFHQVPILWERWWLDIFITFSIISMIALLVIGVYLLMADLSREEQRGTLNFLRLSPQTASSILIGKILGVPILLYSAIALTLPLHLIAGLKAGIPFPLILSLYLVVGTACACFYSAGLLSALVSSTFGGFQVWLASGLVLGFVTIFTMMMTGVSEISHTPFDWLYSLYPGIILPHLINATGIEYNSFLHADSLAEISWFGQGIWGNATTTTLVLVANFSLLNYWLWQGLNRRFHNATMTVWSKTQSYWLSGSLGLVVLGFVAQVSHWQNPEDSYILNFAIFLGFEMILLLGLTAALSPHRQTLLDWARYRHQAQSKTRNLLRDLVMGEDSPALLAIAVNLGILTLMMLPLAVALPLEEHRPAVFGAMVFNISLILIYAGVAQLFLLMKTSKRAVWSAVGVTTLLAIPLIIAAVFQLDPYQQPLLWLFTAIPVVAFENVTTSTVLWGLLGQWTAVTLLTFQMQRQLRKAGESSTKQLMTKSPTAVS